MKFKFILLMFSMFASVSSSSLFSSTDALKQLFAHEQRLMPHIEQQLRSVERQLNLIESLLESSKNIDKADKKESDKSDEIEEYVSHPLNSFKLLQRISTTWPQLKKTLANNNSCLDENLRSILRKFPVSHEMEGAASGIFLLQETYNLDMLKMAQGIIEVPGSNEEIRAQHQLDLHDLENLAKLAFNRGFHDRALEWASAALNKSSSPHLTALLTTLRRHHDQVLDRRGPRGPDHRTYALPLDPSLARKKRYREIKDKKQNLRARDYVKVDKMGEEHQWEIFNALCRGEKLQNRTDIGLKCAFYDNNEDVFLRLAPFKMETIHLEPAITVVHDFISEKEAKTVRELAMKKLKRSSHQGKLLRHGTVKSLKRTSAQTWMFEAEPEREGAAPEMEEPEPETRVGEEESTFVVHEVANRISSRIQHLTRLKVHFQDGSEAFQVANYGLGGVYNHHTDSMGEFWPGGKSEFASKSGRYEGERVMTLMMYLADVRAGGATVFSAARRTVWPRLGKLVMWFNHDQVGRVDMDTMHGGCPVLAGSKWIANKWVRFYPQYRVMPCANHIDKEKLQRFKAPLL